MASTEIADYQARIFALEQALAVERGRHLDHLREIAAATGLREAQAASLLAGRGSAGAPHGGPGPSPTDSEGSSAGHAPPQGAQEPFIGIMPSGSGKSKTELWLERTRKSDSGKLPAPVSSPEGASLGQSPSVDGVTPNPNPGKLKRWMSRVKGEEASAASQAQPASKMDRWLMRQGKPPASTSSSPQVWGGVTPPGARTPQSDMSIEEEQRLMMRIRDAWSKLDAVMALASDLQNQPPGDDKNTSRQRKCGGDDGHKSPHGAPESPTATATPDNWGSGGGGGGTQMGLRVEEKSRGLTVTHVVPGGQADQAGLEVKDVIKFVNGTKVPTLKLFGKLCQHSGEVVMLDVIRGSGASHKALTLYSRTRPPSPSKDDGAEEGELTSERRAATQEELADAYIKARAAGAVAPVQGPGGHGLFAEKKKKEPVFNKYGKDTLLWVPDSDESGAIAMDAAVAKSKASTGAEPGGFFMFPPGHPDYVPLPPGEAALIAGRQHIHAQERLAPHWSNVVFKSPTGAEIRAQARHATYGILAKVSGPLVNADPITAHTELNNAEQISGCVAYIKRGGAPFTKKARVAVAAGACACVVANHDKETFGMSYTDDGLPFEALNIPCVMISVDIAEKLESSSDWQVTLTPAKGEDKKHGKMPSTPPQGHAHMHPPTENHTDSPRTPETPGGTTAKGFRGLETLPINIKQSGMPLGKPGKKPTMWKKIKLLLP